MSRVKAYTARDICNVKKRDFLSTASIIRAEIDNSIIEASTNGITKIKSQIPQYYVGRQAYDWGEMARTIVAQLREDGYSVIGVYDNFTISWGDRIKEDKDFISVPSVKKRN
jgi:hypothetical protein